MQLTYRGIQYQPQSIGQATVPTPEAGIYRGTRLTFRKLQEPMMATGFAVLTYRGADYRSPRYSQPLLHLLENAVAAFEY